MAKQLYNTCNLAEHEGKEALELESVTSETPKKRCFLGVEEFT